MNEPAADSPDTAPIGVFDSGIGGLTVADAIRRRLLNEDIYYIGDTARVPYGTRSPDTVERYSMEIGGLLLAERAKILVVACNTASAIALPRLRRTLRVPVVGVIEPGAAKAVESTRNGRIGVIGTRATIASRAYEREIRRLDPAIEVVSQACPLLVPLIEEGWFEAEETMSIARKYLAPLLDAGVDTLVLGCTHYPLLRNCLARAAGEGISLVDSAHNCAEAVAELLATQQLATTEERTGRLRVALTDQPDTFLQVVENALTLQVGEVEFRTVQGGRTG